MARDTLTRDQIIQAAIELLDSEGLEAFSMRVLGSRLGFAATAVYWHVGSKENLITLAASQAWEEIALPDLMAVEWRSAATAMATEMHEMLIRHPWIVQVVCLGKSGPFLKRACEGIWNGEWHGTSAIYAGADHREAA